MQRSVVAVTASFYDELAPFYHLIYENWETAVSTQGAGLAAVLRAHGIQPGDSVLDAASGIGTQAIGLVTQGYRVAASDISPGAIARLKAELSHRGLRAEASVDDIRTLARAEDQSFSAVIACDNSIPHMLSDGEILEAFRSCLRCLLPGGVAMFSVRDYAIIERRSPDVRPYGLRYADGNRHLAVQVWEWDEDQYDLRMYLTCESASGTCDTRVLRTRYYAVSIARLLELMAEAGFVDVQRRDDVLFQPTLIGARPNAA
jgi:SAM-dependent methyltransferase